MQSRDEATLPAMRPKSRKSLAHETSAKTMDKENMTADIAALGNVQKRVDRHQKKPRSKSIGPGGLDALKDTAGNRRKSIAAPPPRSILKPTLPRLQEISSHNTARKTSPKKTPQASQDPNLLGDIEKRANTSTITRPSGHEDVDLPNSLIVQANPVINETRVLLRTEEQQQASAREREDKGSLDTEKDLITRREARRKSLANRRVSFAPEATLHTWDVVEYLQDSTTSSASTNSTRRASSVSGGIIGSPHPQSQASLESDPSEPPSTPPEQIDDKTVNSPAHQRDLHSKKRRRSSVIPPLNFNNPDDEAFSSSPSSSSSVDDDVINQGFTANEDDDVSDSNSDSDNEGTAMSLDVENTTDMSMASIRSTSSSTGSSARLEEALQLAARQAGTQGIDFDENGDLGPSQDEEVVGQFQPWSKESLKIFSPSQDQENINPFSTALGTGIIMKDGDQDEDNGVTMEMTRAVGGIIPEQQSDEEITMEMTVAVGGILQAPQGNSAGLASKRVASGRRQSSRRRSSAESSLGDQTMDLTIAVGEIQQAQERDDTRNDIIDDEDMTMELTSVIGGVLAPAKETVAKGRRRSSAIRRRSVQDTRRQGAQEAQDNDAMDMTKAIGGIISNGVVGTTGDETVGVDVDMDMTRAIGGILTEQPNTGNTPQVVSQAEPEKSHADIMGSTFHPVLSSTPKSKTPAVTIASETGSPSLAAFKGKGLRRSGAARTSITPKSTKKASTNGTPVRKSTTPLKQETPRVSTVVHNTSMHTESSSTFVNIQSKADRLTPKASPLKSQMTPNKLFQKDHNTGALLPSIILTPQKRRISGIGADRAGLGSPQVAALLDRRQSIGDQATTFTPGGLVGGTHVVHFDNPQILEKELDRDRQEGLDREDGRKIMEREADAAETEKDATINLKEMIQSLTPKKRSLKGRKSLHVGAARGILGKRPVELDEEDQDNDDDESGVKRLKNHEGSPVKNVKLKAPPSKAETTGRLTRAARRSLQEITENIITPTIASSPQKVTTPKGQDRFRGAEPLLSAHPVVPFVDRSAMETSTVEDEEFSDERIHLQDFLDMTSIRFMELTTTKRRHTAVPNGTKDGIAISSTESCDIDNSLESCVVAGACTVPMLELFQHSCRELKKYMSEGRSIVREIETETFEENPPLFREYMSATPDVRILMDNQFKNVKTHARLLSKAMWYEWRMKLLEGLKDGLYKISDGMDGDVEILQHQEHILNACLPALVEKYEGLVAEEADLQKVAHELANCDQEELSDVRQRLVSVEVDIDSKKRMVLDLQRQLQEKEADISSIKERKQACLSDIEQAERIREACRGWSANEGLAYKARVDDQEEQHGWAITGVIGSQLSMTYRREIELVFDASSFKPNNPNGAPAQPIGSRIDLWYVAGTRELNPLPLSVEKDFFLQNIRECCRGLPQPQTTVRELLDTVSSSWTKALEIVGNIRSLHRSYPIEVIKTSDSSILVRSVLLLSQLVTKVDIQFDIHVDNAPKGLDVKVEPQSTVIYGERFNEAKMGEFLISRITSARGDKESWGGIVMELEEKLLARGRK